MKKLMKGRISPQSGVAFELKKGQYLKITDPLGEQVSDLICYKLHDKEEWLSSGRTLDYANAWLIKKGHILYSNRSNPMLTLLEDTCGRHDFLLTPCSLEMFHKLYKVKGHHPSCHENLYSNLKAWGIAPDEVPTTFNIFMNVQIFPDGSLSVEPPLSKAGDYVMFRAEMDLVVGLTACSAGQSNNGSFKPIDYEINE
ncbi:DUF1989 domain-containing protein [Cesiribacter sp. SM1]|uniref:DUF1989 domain-containing protein n=1 Tax=Cesiribacter sp. SM1 TaxID=2861196 RepID=UPI001CD73CB9|nr:urea carboxylase-associated family protein [Cesiribacter sp. SM1]